MSFEKAGVRSGVGKLKVIAYNLEKTRLQLAKMMIINRLPFRIDKGERFRTYSRYLYPILELPHRTTLVKDCMKLYDDEKFKLNKLMKIRGCVSPRPHGRYFRI